MSYAVEWSRQAERQLGMLDPQVARALVRFVHDRVHASPDPRIIGKRLRDSELWRYRVGDYRILCLIEDERLVVLVVEVGHRRDVYR